MKNLENFFICIIIIFSLIGFYKSLGKVNSFRIEMHKNKVIHEYAKKLKGCFDLENKSQRRISESLDLIKYCMKKFRIE